MLLPVLVLVVLLLLAQVGDGERARVRAKLLLPLVLRIALRVRVGSREYGKGHRALVLVLVLGSGLSVGPGQGERKSRTGKGEVWGEDWMDAHDKLRIVSRSSERTGHNIPSPPVHFVFCLPRTCPKVPIRKGAKNRRVRTRRFKRNGGEKGCRCQHWGLCQE